MGLHSGAPVNLRILPAPAGSGVIFRRTDLDGFELEAISRNVARVSYATSLMKKGVLISTTEHLLSALIGCGIDNAIVELDNLELPILDGSALPFVNAIRNAGIRRQRRPRTYLRIRRELEVREGDKFVAVYPAETYSVSYAINFPHPLIGKETFKVDLSDGNYRTEIAAARTFGFLHEADAMRQQGLIRGASPENAIVLTRDGVMNPPLRFPDEFVRHKVLDLIGVDREERPLLAGEEHILQHREDQAAQGECLPTQPAFFQVHDHPVAFIHCLPHGEGRCLAHDVAEVRVGRECRRLIKDRLPHRGSHGLARLVVAEFKVLADLRVLDFFQASGTESRIGEQESEFDQRETVRRKHEERVPQKFIRARPKGVEMPAIAEDLRQFRRTNKIGAVALKRVESDRNDGIGRLNKNGLPAQVAVLLPLPCVDGP